MSSSNRPSGFTWVRNSDDGARRLLLAGRSPGAVAAATGFYDQAHLTRHFKRLVGVPPGRYRLGREFRP